MCYVFSKKKKTSMRGKLNRCEVKTFIKISIFVSLCFHCYCHLSCSISFSSLDIDDPFKV